MVPLNPLLIMVLCFNFGWIISLVFQKPICQSVGIVNLKSPAYMAFQYFFTGKQPVFNISWLRRDHPVLNIGDLSMEASHNLGLLLDQLRFPTVKSLSNSVIIVLIKRYWIFFLRPQDINICLLLCLSHTDCDHYAFKRCSKNSFMAVDFLRLVLCYPDDACIVIR